MSDLTGVPPSAPAPAQPQTVCGFCRRPIADQYFEFMGKICCPPCADGVTKMAELNLPDSAATLRGAIFGIGAALLAGVLWGIVTRVTNAEWGILAVGVGWMVSSAIKAGSGGRRGPHMQAMAVVIALFGILFGKIFTVFIILYERVPIDEAVRLLIRLLQTKPMALFTGFDLIWFFIAILRPMQTFKPLNLRIRGPFSLSAGPVQALQFDRAQPIAAKPPAGPVA